MNLFRDRKHAGSRLAEELQSLSLPDDTIVLGLARGGVPVAFEVAMRLDLSLDVFVVRKLGVPFQPELAFGAIATGDARILNDDIIDAASISDEKIDEVTQHEKRELHRRETRYRRGQQAPDFQGQTVVLVDDGMATGASMAVAVDALKEQNPGRLIVAVPVGTIQATHIIDRRVDELVCLASPDPFGGVGAWYDEFGQTTDNEVKRLLDRAQNRPTGQAPSRPRA